MTREEVQLLLDRYKNGTCTDEENAFLEAWFIEFNKSAPLEITELELKNDLKALDQGLLPTRKIKTISITRYSVAAASIVACFILFWFLFSKKSDDRFITKSHELTRDSLPDSAIFLTLSDGRKIRLDQAENGKIASFGSTDVTKVAPDLVTFSYSDKTAQASNNFNTITTPLGKHIKIVLPDGSKVWLNSLSSIRFPTTFSAQKRSVSMTGEAFFDIVHISKQPFLIDVAGQQIEDLGTQFNVNAYPDEEMISTTLVSGLARVNFATNSVLIKPSQQALLSRKELHKGFTLKSNVDIETITGWKDGYFKFRQSNFDDVIRQFARWYNIEVRYKGAVPNVQLSGEILRTSSRQSVYQLLEFYKVDFQVENSEGGKDVLLISGVKN